MKKCFYCNFFVNYNPRTKEAVCDKRGIMVRRSQNGCELAVYSSRPEQNMGRELKEGQTFISTCSALGKKGDGVFKTNSGFVVIAKDTKPNKRYELKITKVMQRLAFADKIKEVKE